MLLHLLANDYREQGEEVFSEAYSYPSFVKEGRLFLEAGHQGRQVHCLRFEAGTEQLVIGRKQACDLCIPDGNVSGRHAAVHSPATGEDHYRLEDLGSTNGTLLNGMTVPPHERVPLRSQDVVSFGPFASFGFLEPKAFVALVAKEARRAPEEGPPETEAWSREALEAAAQRADLKATALAGLYLLVEGQEPIALQAGVRLILGRSPESADVVLPDNKVSRRHMELLVVGETVSLTDLGSANGVLVAGRRIPTETPTPVRLGTEFKICDLSLSVVGAEAAEELTQECKVPPVKRTLVRGDLAQLGLGKMLMAVDARQKTGRLEIEGRGWISFRAGSPWAAATEEGKRGIEAVRGLLDLASGPFTLDSAFVPSGEREIEGTFGRLLLA